MKIQIQKYVRFFGRVGALVLLMMGTIVSAVWFEPVSPILPNNPGWAPVVPDYTLNHALNDSQHKNYFSQPDFVFSVGSPDPVYNAGAQQGGGGGNPQPIGNALSPFLALVSGNFTQIVANPAFYSFPEATYVEGMKLMTGNITAESRPDTAGGMSTIVPGFIKSQILFTGNTCSDANNPCNTLFLEGGDNPALPAGDKTNDMVNIFLGNVSNPVAGVNYNPLINTNRFGVERGGQFAALRMGQVYVDKAFVGGGVTAGLTTLMNANMPGNFVGNFVSLPDASNLAKPEVLQGGISYGAGTLATTKFSNIGYGDYCYLQNPQVGAICPDGFFLSKYDGVNEAICRSFNPSPNPQAVNVKPDFRRNINLPQDVGNHINSPVFDCKSTPPSWVCSDGLDNDGDGLTDYPNDPGCSDGFDMSEYNAPPAPPPPSPQLVTTLVNGPFLTKSCNQNGLNSPSEIFVGGWKAITYMDIPPLGVNPQIPATQMAGIFASLPNSGYARADGQMHPQKYDLLVSKGTYFKTPNGQNLAKVGPLQPGWYFVWNGGTPLSYKIKIGFGDLILDTNQCW